MLNFNRVLIHSLYICICAKIRCHTKHHNTPSKIWLQHLSQTGHYVLLFLISSWPAEFHLPSTKKYSAWSKLIHFIVNELSLHSAETDNRLISARILNPLSPNSDQHQFSPNNIHTLSSVTSMRINQMITKRKISDLLSISPN